MWLRLASTSSAIVSSIVSAASRYHAVTASRWPIRWRAVLGLVVHRGRPLELEERDVRRARERDALRGDARRADDELRAVGPLERADRLVALAEGVGAEQVRRVGEALEHRALDVDVAGEDDERLAGLEEVGDPLQRGAELAARRQPLERRELREALGAQRRRDPRVELGEVERLLAQPGDDVLLGEPVLALVVERDGHDDAALRRELGEDLGLQAPDEAAPAQVPVQALLGQRPLELAREARARAEVLEAADDPQLADELVGVVEDRRAGQREAQRVVVERRGQPADRLRALGLRVLRVVRLVDDERARVQARELLAVRGDDLVVEDRDLAGLAGRRCGPRPRRRRGAAASASSRAPS